MINENFLAQPGAIEAMRARYRPIPDSPAEFTNRDKIALNLGLLAIEDVPVLLDALTEARDEVARVHQFSDSLAIRQAREAGARDMRERAMAVVGGMAERPYDNEPEFSAVLMCEAAIRALPLAGKPS